MGRCKLQPIPHGVADRDVPCDSCRLRNDVRKEPGPIAPATWWLLGVGASVPICEGCAQIMAQDGFADGPAD